MAPSGIEVVCDRFYLFPAVAPTRPALLVRVALPRARNSDEMGVELVEALARAKAEALAWAWSPSGTGPPAPIGYFAPYLSEECPEDAPLLTFHGGELELWSTAEEWWTAVEQRPAAFVIGPGAHEDEFWEWVAGAFDDDGWVAWLRRPARKIAVRLVTEADARLVDTPLLLIDDVDWLTGEEFGRLSQGGLTALTARPPARSPAVTEAEFRAVKLGFVERAIADALARGDRWAAAFRSSELAGFDPPAALALIERLAGSVKLWDERHGIARGLAYALHRMRREPGGAELLERWRAAPDRLRSEVLAELEKFDRCQ